MKKERQDMLYEVRSRIADEVKIRSGAFSSFTLQGERHDFDFTITRQNGTKKNLKVYTTQSAAGNTAVSETVLNKKKVNYIVLYLDDKDTYVFKKEDVIASGKMTKDGRIHFSSVLNNMDNTLLIEAKNNFKRMFLEY